MKHELKIPHQSNPKPVYIKLKDTGRVKAVVTDGKGNAYYPTKEDYALYEGKYDPDTLIDPDTYEFVRFFRGMDF